MSLISCRRGIRKEKTRSFITFKVVVKWSKFFLPNVQFSTNCHPLNEEEAKIFLREKSHNLQPLTSARNKKVLNWHEEGHHFIWQIELLLLLLVAYSLCSCSASRWVVMRYDHSMNFLPMMRLLIPNYKGISNYSTRPRDIVDKADDTRVLYINFVRRRRCHANSVARSPVSWFWRGKALRSNRLKACLINLP